jgi:spermidine/putrescine transport system ATP-binding protein
VSISFNEIILQDNENDGMLSGKVSFILYKGNHYHLTITTTNNQSIFVDTHDVWDIGDRVGINILARSINIEPV